MHPATAMHARQRKGTENIQGNCKKRTILEVILSSVAIAD